MRPRFVLALLLIVATTTSCSRRQPPEKAELEAYADTLTEIGKRCADTLCQQLTDGTRLPLPFAAERRHPFFI